MRRSIGWVGGAAVVVMLSVQPQAAIASRTASPPAVTGVSPPSGPLDGNIQVTVTGIGFTGANEVDFGSKKAGFDVKDDSTIIAVSPGGSAGTVDVRVTTPAGKSQKSNADHFTYQGAPVVNGLDPVSGPPGGGLTVTISGSTFIGASEVH